MSRAEFARALGWAPSTISRWESGKAEPSRLALKIILAFGEERGVRWRPARPTLPVPFTPAAPSVDLMPSQAWSAPDARTTVIGARHPRWQAELRFRVAVDRPTEPAAKRWLGNATIAVASCAVLLLGFGVFSSGNGRASSPIAANEEAAPAFAARPAVARSVTPHRAHAVVAPIAETAPAPEPIAVSEEAAPAPAETPVMARLEGVTLLGTLRRATFRTDVDALTVLEGEQLGERQAVRIAGHGVELTDAAGHVQLVHLGESVAIE